MAADSLLQTCVELVAMSGPNGYGLGSENALREAPGAREAGEQEVFIERRFQRPRVGNTQDRPGLLEVVGDTGARLETVISGGAGVVLSAKANLEQEIARLDRILHIEGILIDVGGCMEAEQTAAAGEIEGEKTR